MVCMTKTTLKIDEKLKNEVMAYGRLHEPPLLFREIVESELRKWLAEQKKGRKND